MKDEFVSTEHLFLATIEVPSVAKDMLIKFKIDKESVLKVLEDLKSSRSGEPAAPKKFKALSKFTLQKNQ